MISFTALALLTTLAPEPPPKGFASEMQGTPEKTIVVHHSLDQIERCLVLNSKISLVPYRTADKPGNSILLWRNEMGSGRIVWELQEERASTRLRVWEGTTWLNYVSQCFD